MGELNKRHVGRTKLPRAGLPSPMISDLPGFFEDFAAFFRGGGLPETLPGPIDERIDNADFMLCTEPAVLCGALAMAFPGRPIIGYFANPLMSYVPAAHSLLWLGMFRELTGSGGAASSAAAPLLPVASTRFLAEQMRYQTGARVLASRPLATYLGPPKGSPRYGEAVVVRAPSVFWSSACVLNNIAHGNRDELLEAFDRGGGVGLPVDSLRFTASEELKDGSSEAFAAFSVAVIFPYDVSQMRLYELYALGMPIFLPDRLAMPCFLYRGMTTMEDFAHELPKPERTSAAVVPYLDRDPFLRDDWHAVAAWSQLTHWMTLPNLVNCKGAADMMLRLVGEDLRPLVGKMHQRQALDVARGVRFWTGALGALRHLGLQS